jgi:hypothetical protein
MVVIDERRRVWRFCDDDSIKFGFNMGKQGVLAQSFNKSKSLSGIGGLLSIVFNTT